MHEFSPPELRRGFRVGFAVVMVLVTAIPFALMVLGATGTMHVRYAIDDTALHVETGSFLDGRRDVPLDAIRDASVVVLRGGRRTRGTGFPGYCTGRFSYAEIGSVWQATDCSARAVLIRASGEALPIVTTPPDPDAFVADLRARTPTIVSLPPPNAEWLRALLAGGALLVLLVDAGLVALCLFGPRRMRYVVDVASGELEVQTLFSSRRFPLRGLRAKTFDARRSLRIWGAALPGYFTGRFRSEGASMRVYATDLASGILLDGDERVFVSPEDRAGFLAAVRDAGGKAERA